MKHYTVEITNEALADMEQLYNHIAYVLQAPENAMDQYNRIADAILTLDTMAERRRISGSQAGESLRVSADIPAGEIEKNTDKK